jgi:protein-disulfide isomerase
MKELTAGYAEQLGLDVAQFRADFDKPAYATEIKKDLALVEKLDVRGTPNFYINGVNIVGAQPLDRFQEIVDEQLEMAARKKKEGVSADQMYQTLVAANYAEAQARGEVDAKPPEPEQIVEMVPVDKDDAVKGSADKALVTVVEFSDFQCPFCSRAASTVDQIEKKYGDKVRVVFKHLPLPFHQEADEAAKLAMAAQKEGKFWEMHDLLFENQRALREEGTFVDLGKKVGLSERQVERALASDTYQKRLEEDIKQAQKVGARGTPTFYINGVQLVGAQPFSAFEAVIDEQIEVAEKLQKDKKVSGEKLYEAAVAYNKANAPSPEAGADAGDEEPAPRVDTSKLTVDKDQVKGPADAKVTVFVFSDFQCPYCRMGAQRFDEALENVQDQVKVVYKHYPLPFHKEAEPAAKAAMAAGEQGKFWAMHDLLFQNQQRLTEEGIYAELAKELGLDVEQFQKDMGKKAYDEQIAADMKQADAIGVRGTPSFFIDGTRVVGAQQPETFEKAIKEALSEKQ